MPRVMSWFRFRGEFNPPSPYKGRAGVGMGFVAHPLTPILTFPLRGKEWFMAV